MNINNLFLALLTAMMLFAMPSAAVEIRGVPFDQASAKYNDTLSWDAETFQGFLYAFPVGKSSEKLTIDQPASSLSAKSREIKQDKLVYETTRSEQKFRVFMETGKKLENGDSAYHRLGWFGDLYVAVNGKANKLAKLIKEQRKEEKQTLKLGESWSLGEGYNVTFDIDAKTSPRQAKLILSKNNKILDIWSADNGEVVAYIRENIGNESNVPIFVTYIESVFAGTGNEMVQLRYTWLISSQNVIEVKSGDKFGIFEVKEANENNLLLYNKDKAVDLNQNTVVDLAGGIKFRVADSATALRFYPFKDIKDPAPQTQPTVGTTATANNTISAIQANLSGVSSVQSPSATDQISVTMPKLAAIAPPKSGSTDMWLIWATIALALAVAGYFTYPYILKQQQLVPPTGEK